MTFVDKLFFCHNTETTLNYFFKGLISDMKLKKNCTKLIVLCKRKKYFSFLMLKCSCIYILLANFAVKQE